MLRLSSKIARQFSSAFPRSFETVSGRMFAGPQSCIGRQQTFTVCASARTSLPALVGGKLNANTSCFAESSYICRSYSAGKEVEKTTTTASESETGTSDSSEAVSSTSRKRPPTNFERKIFVWSGKYKTANEVPDQVSEAALNSAKNKFRIYVNIGMGVATLVAAIAMVIIGKSRAKKGESVSNINIRRHPETYSKLIESQNAPK
ncbi:UPF0389 protein CG9231-like [Asterias rubens]|uniref:UPF0389 protein CG9231-like n=1 Tax=Asterias rubens TaxID=7604 RepID=UPI0014558EB0|nr:UPF0389 protein CG9231-like [Asterias rubens]